MNTKSKSKIFSIGLAVASVALCGCKNPITESFEATRPWHDTGASYEKLVYDVNIYDVRDGSEEDKRKVIAQGGLVYELTEQTRVDGSINYSRLRSDFSVTYNDDASEADRGLTDRITNSVEFQSDSLITSHMQKSVELADRDGATNNSYSIEADYFGTHKATLTMTGKDDAQPQTMTIPNNTYRDNEMMYYLARATAINKGATTNFNMTNIFDSFIKGEFTVYGMTASAGSETATVDIGDWVKDYGVEAVTDEEQNTSYPVPCYYVTIMINEAKHGPPHYVYYSEKPFTDGGKEHKKIPVKIFYYEYNGSKASKMTEFVLTSCSFENTAND